MCGIVSMILKDQKKVLGKEYTEMFKQMLHADAVRGWDSTGIAAIRHKGDVHVVKDACVPSDLFAMVQDHTWIYQNRAYIGHNRWATRGKTNAENAHPFREDNITLVHNGTLRFHTFLKNVEVDSHAITHAIAEKGAINTLEILDGAYALVWYDETTGYIHATRNEERPLHLLETEDLYILSSESGLVRWICERFKVKVRKCTPINTGVLYTFRKNKKDQTIIETVKYTPLPQVDYTHTQGTYLPNVHQIKPYTSPDPALEGLKIGMTINVLPFFRKVQSFRHFNIGNTQWDCESPLHPNLSIELFTEDTEEDLYEKVVPVTIERMFSAAGLHEASIVVRLATEEEAKNVVVPEKKTDAESTAPITTINGIALSDEVCLIAKDCLCLFCSEPFVKSEEIALFPVKMNDHVYKYHYYCPDCSGLYSPKNPRIRALH